VQKNPLVLRAVAAASTLLAVSAAHAAPVSGVVGGAARHPNALVCLDANGNGRCDAGELATRTDSSGRFTLPREGALVAQTLLAGRLVTLRSPVQAHGVVSPITTELQSLMEAHGTGFDAARTALAARLGIEPGQLLADPLALPAGELRSALLREDQGLVDRLAEATREAGATGDRVAALRNRLSLDAITHVVIIYAENRSFDNLFGLFPGANNLRRLGKLKQVDRDGTTVLPMLPPAWGGLTAAGQSPAVSQAQTTNVWPNAPFQIDAASNAFGYPALPSSIVTRDLYHRFFENQMQIDGGRSDQYAAWGDSGGLVMGGFDGRGTAMWKLAKHYTLADNFFQAAYGGSFLNHQYLVCACAPTVPASVVSANGMSINQLAAPVNGVPQLQANASQTASALDGAPSLKSGNIAPLDWFGPGDGYRAVNTMQPAYQPSGNKPADAAGQDSLYANPKASNTLPPQTQTTIGDLLSARGIDWAWYSGGWSAAAANPYPYDPVSNTFGSSTTIYYANSFGTADASHGDFQAHHQPFNYYAAFDPVAHADARSAHLKDRSDLLAQAAAGTLPAVSFYKPIGFQNQHPGYTNLTEGDDEIATVIQALQASPQWRHMLVLVTYDEFGGQFDHASPPKADLIGPGTRIPAVLVSPFAKRGFVDHTQYDTASFLRFITHRWSLPLLDGLAQRDASLVANGGQPMGDLTNALFFQEDSQ